jgi:hypothetical protein
MLVGIANVEFKWSKKETIFEYNIAKKFPEKTPTFKFRFQ